MFKSTEAGSIMGRILTLAALATAIAVSAAPASATVVTAAFGSSSLGSYSFYGDGTDANSNFVGIPFHIGAGGIVLTGITTSLDGNVNILPPSASAETIFAAIVPVPTQFIPPSFAPCDIAANTLVSAVFTPPTSAGPDLTHPLISP